MKLKQRMIHNNERKEAKQKKKRLWLFLLFCISGIIVRKAMRQAISIVGKVQKTISPIYNSFLFFIFLYKMLTLLL